MNAFINALYTTLDTYWHLLTCVDKVDNGDNVLTQWIPFY